MLKNYFFILGLPRTRSTWLANFLTHKTGFCFHEAVRLCYKIEDLKTLLDSLEEKNTGDADTMLLRYEDKIVKLFPNAKWVIIERDFNDVMFSIEKRYNFKESHVDWKLFKGIERKINNFKKKYDVMRVDFNELNTFEVCKQVWDYCIPDTPCDYKRWMQLDVIKMDPIESKMLEFHGSDAKRSVKDYI